MSLATLDTHEVVKDTQAEAVARNMRKARDLDLPFLATKLDLERMRTDLTGEIQNLRTDVSGGIGMIRTAIADSEAETVKWVGAIGFQTLTVLGGVIGLIKSLKPRGK